MSEPVWTGEAIKAVRNDLDLKMREAADLVGVSESYWSNLESNRRRPNRQTVILLNMLRSGMLRKSKVRKKRAQP